MNIPPPQINRIDEWLFSVVDQILTELVADSVSKLSSAIYAPVGVVVSISLFLYALAVMRGLIEEPIQDFMWRVLKVSIISSICFTGGIYANEIVPILIALPDDLSAAVLGSPGINGMISDMLVELMEPIGTLDVGPSSLLTNSGGAILAIITAVIMTVCGAFLSVVSSLILIVVKVATTLLVCVGPLFIAALLFKRSEDYFYRWVSQLINYAVLGLLFTLLFRVVMGVNLALVRASAEWVSGDAVPLAAVIFAYLFVFGASIYIFLQLPAIASGLTAGAGLQFAGPGRMIGRAVRGR